VSSARVESLLTGRSHVEDVSDADLATALADGATFTDDVNALTQADALIIAVPSPLGRNREPDTSYIAAAADTNRKVVRPGMLVSLESTTDPGTTRKRCR
jgi:UDP-N-acetyl-D-glucosamine dehydrogenase